MATCRLHWWLVPLWLRGRLSKRLYSEWIKWKRIFRTNKICSNCVGDPNKTDLGLFGVTVRYPKLHCRSAPKLTPSADKQSSHVLVIDATPFWCRWKVSNCQKYNDHWSVHYNQALINIWIIIVINASYLFILYWPAADDHKTSSPIRHHCQK